MSLLKMAYTNITLLLRRVDAIFQCVFMGMSFYEFENWGKNSKIEVKSFEIWGQVPQRTKTHKKLMLDGKAKL